MANEATPQPDAVHDTPSLPGSPLPKRTKYTEPAPNLSVASILNDSQPTPTPESAPLMDPMSATLGSAAAMPSFAPNLPSMSLEPPPPAMQVKLLSPAATAPTRGSAFAAGYDLYASAATTVPAGGRTLVETDISLAVPPGTYGRVAPRSGLAVKHGIQTGAGVIDCDYRGPVKVLLFNHGDVDFSIAAGDRIAQLVIERIYNPELVVVDNLDETVRGAGGFGSTGGFGGSLPGINGGLPA